MAKYLVTGGCGFIGSHLVDSLMADGHVVRVLDDLSTGKRGNVPPEVEIVIGDVASAGLVRQCMADADGCFHLAAVASVQRSTEDWVGTHRTNLTGSIAVFDAARPRGAVPARPVVFASSAAVYGGNTRLPLTEAAEPRPLSAYGADKLGCELHGAVAGEAYGVPVTGLRFFNVYGPRQDPASPYSGVIGIFADRILGNRALTIFGDGEQTRDFVYVADVVRFLRGAMDRAAPGLRVLNVCTGRTTTLLDLAATLGEVCGRHVGLVFEAPRQGDIRASLGSPTAAAAALGITADTPLGEGLAATVAFLAAGR